MTFRALGLVAVAAALASAPAPARAANPIQDENARPASPTWAVRDETTAIEGYADTTSAAPGERVGFHVASSVPGVRYRIEVYRLGWYGGGGGRLVTCLPSCETDRPAPAPTSPAVDPQTGVLRAAWPETDALVVPPDWVSGYYEARLRLTAGAQAGRFYPVWLVVREPELRASAIVVQAPVNTWQAYNNWGGRSLYDFNSGGSRASRISFDRPYAVGVPGAQASPLPWEIQLVRFLEREGYDVSYQTDVDTDRDPASLLRHRLVMTAGHSEYWTKAMRDGFESARDQGTNLVFTGANNAYWQVRYEDGRRTLVGYKSLADPVGDPALETVRFRDLAQPRPECALVGVQFKEEGEFGRGDYRVVQAALADPWLVGTGLDASSTLELLVADEHDWLPVPPPPGCGQPGLTVLFHADGPPPADAVRYVAPSGARVFASGSMQFSWGLDAYGTDVYGHGPADPRLQQFMRNALADLLRPAAPAAVKATAERGLVRVAVELRPDPRVREVVVTRYERNARTVVCRALPCTDRVPGHRTYAYAASVTDPWGESPAAFSEPVAVPNSPPAVRLAGPRVARVGRRAVYSARSSDADGDPVAYRWRLDGRPRSATGPRLALRFRSPGRHRVTVAARDGQGGVTQATLVVRVRSKA